MSPPFLNHSHGFLLLEGLKLTFTLKTFPILLSSLIHYHFLCFLCCNYAESSISSNFSFKRAENFLSVSLSWIQSIWVCSSFYFSILWSAWKMLLFIATAHLCWSLTVPQTRSLSVLFTWSHHNSMASMLSLATFPRWRLRLMKLWKLLKAAELVKWQWEPRKEESRAWILRQDQRWPINICWMSDWTTICFQST